MQLQLKLRQNHEQKKKRNQKETNNKTKTKPTEVHTFSKVFLYFRSKFNYSNIIYYLYTDFQ